jgi:hypothetical protein
MNAGLHRLALATAAATTAGMLALAGCAARGAPARAAGGSATVTTSAVRTPASGAAHIIAYSINSDGPRFAVIVTGAVGDHGAGMTVYPDGKVDPEHTSELSLRLGRGSFRLRIAALDKKVIRAYQHWPGNQATCSGSIAVSAPAPVVAGSGTGLYKRISGSFTLTTTIDEIDARPCNGTGRFLSQVIVIAGPGSVRFG